MMALRLIALAALVLFPGSTATRLLDRGSFEFWEIAYLDLVIGTVSVSMGALFLASLGHLRLVYLLTLVLLPALALRTITRKRVAIRGSIKAGKVICMALVIIAVVLVISPPSRIVYGWSDVGIYPNIAAHMARKGRITIEDSLVRLVSPENRDFVYRPNQDPLVPMEAYQNKALFITDFEKGEITPQFLYLWPSLMAVFALFLGVEKMFWAVTWVSLLALGGLLLVARRWLGGNWAYPAAFLTLISPLFLYFSKYTTSEMMNMCIFVAAVLCHAAYMESQRMGRSGEAVRMAMASALLLCAGFLCRIDFFLLLLPILLFYLFKRLFSDFHVADWIFFLLCLCGGILCAALDYALSKPYFVRLMVSNEGPVRFLLSFPGALVLPVYLVIFIAGRRFCLRARPWLAGFVRRGRSVLPALLSSGLAAYVSYLCFIRPGEPQTFGSYGEINAVIGPTYNNETLLRWAWYLSWPGIVAMFAGYALFFSLRREFSSRLFAAIGLTFTVVYSLSLHNTPVHIIAMRRLVPVILPMGMIMIVYAIRTVFDLLKWPRAGRILSQLGRVAGTGALLCLAAFFISVAQPVFGLQEGGNQYELFQNMSDNIPQDGVVIMDLYAGDICGVPLKCIFDVENLWLTDNFILGGEEFLSLLRDTGFPQRPAYLLWRPGMNIVPIPKQEALRYDLVCRLFWREEMLEQSFVSRPGKRVYHLESFEIYKISEVK